MRPPRVLDSRGVAFEFALARTIVSHPRSYDSPCASFQGEDACTPARNVSGDILRVAARYARA
jgi:hypothetical protein